MQIEIELDDALVAAVREYLGLDDLDVIINLALREMWDGIQANRARQIAPDQL
jgi:Arc/MetJ family transcription regulator